MCMQGKKLSALTSEERIGNETAGIEQLRAIRNQRLASGL